MPGFGEGGICAQSLQPLSCPEANRQYRRNLGRLARPQGPDPDTHQWLHQVVLPTNEHLPPSQLLPAASTLGTPSPGCLRGSQTPLGECGGPGSVFPFFYYSSRLRTPGDRAKKRGPLSTRPFQIPPHFLTNQKHTTIWHLETLFPVSRRRERGRENEREWRRIASQPSPIPPLPAE